ncbi:MAG: phosphatase PAP2 family protein [Streptosporangiaceae bacterium]
MTGVWQAFSLVGSAVLYVPMILVVYWCVSPAWGARLAVMLSFSGVLNELLKTLFHAPRPYWTHPGIRTPEPIAGYGMPSGHAQNSIVVWGTLARLAGTRRAWVAAGVLGLGIGLSRIFLHVHSPTQVLAGWMLGGGVLATALVLGPAVLVWWRARRLAVQLGLSLLVPLVLLFCVDLAVDSQQGWRMPEAWVEAIRASGGRVPRPSLNNGAAGTGMLAGILAGLSVITSRGGFDAGGPWGRRLARVPVGLGGFVFLYGAGVLFGSHPVPVFVVFLLAGSWATAGAPEVFTGMGLATRGGARTPV